MGISIMLLDAAEANRNAQLRSVELPFELLGEIFSHLVVPESPLELRGVLPVSTSWYTAAIHHPHLWTMIIINECVLEYFKERPSPSDASIFLRQCSLEGCDVYSAHN